MMSQTDAERRVTRALTETDVLSPEGSAVVQNKRGTRYVAIPKRLAQFYDVDQGDEVQRAFDPATGLLIVSLNGYDIFEQ